jgi:hypothetical protein
MSAWSLVATSNVHERGAHHYGPWTHPWRHHEPAGAGARKLALALDVGGTKWEALRAAFDQHARLAFAREMRITPSHLLGDAGLLGAAAFVLEPRRYGW